MIDESLGRKQLVGEALQALQQMRLGMANRLFGGNRHIRFTIVMNRAECATPTRLKRMTETLEHSGFRAVLSRVSGATLVVDCVRSRRESMVVQRVGRDEKSQGSHLVLGHGKGKLLFVCDGRASDRRIVLLTQKDDQVEIWYDHDDDDKPSPCISEFRNQAIAELL